MAWIHFIGHSDDFGSIEISYTKKILQTNGLWAHN